MVKESLTKYFKRNLSNPLLWVHWIVLAYTLVWLLNNAFVGIGKIEPKFPIDWIIFIVFFAILDLTTEKILGV